MNRVAFLSMDDMEDFVYDDDLAIDPLAELGWHVETVSWRHPTVDWSDYRAAIVRTTWDYQSDLSGYLATLSRIHHATLLANPLEKMRWNVDKVYLRDLEAWGLPIVPTIWRDRLSDLAETPRWFEAFSTNQIVIKPTISAGAENTFWLQPDSEVWELTYAAFQDRPFMVQPFLPSVVSEGEFSLYYFDNVYSHTVLKTPKAQDFRVQEEHGGFIRKVEPEQSLLDAARATLDLVEEPLLYARIDMVRDPIRGFLLMELEIVEPSLYLRTDPEAPARFAIAVNEYLRRNR